MVGNLLIKMRIEIYIYASSWNGICMPPCEISMVQLVITDAYGGISFA